MTPEEVQDALKMGPIQKGCLTALFGLAGILILICLGMNCAEQISKNRKYNRSTINRTSDVSTPTPRPTNRSDQVKITTVGTLTRLVPYPDAGFGEEYTRIPQGTTVTVINRTVQSLGHLDVTWLEVSYDGKTGWISQTDTDEFKIPQGTPVTFGSTGSSKKVKILTPRPTPKTEQVRIITPGSRARLLPSPMALGGEYTRIPQGTTLTVISEDIRKSGPMYMTWLKVSYGGHTGWISQYDTDY